MKVFFYKGVEIKHRHEDTDLSDLKAAPQDELPGILQRGKKPADSEPAHASKGKISKVKKQNKRVGGARKKPASAWRLPAYFLKLPKARPLQRNAKRECMGTVRWGIRYNGTTFFRLSPWC